MDGLNELLVMGLPISVVAPVVVQAMRESFGLEKRWTALASMLTCLLLVSLADMAVGAASQEKIAAYVLSAIVYGLAGNGVYSQAKLFQENRGAT